MAHAIKVKGALFESIALDHALAEMLAHPLPESARDKLNRQLKSDGAIEDLAKLAVELREENALCITDADGATQEPKIVCSMGLRTK